MSSLIKAIVIPVYFSINKAPRQHHIELCFSANPVKKASEYIAATHKSWQKADELYRKNNIYGEHQFLIPATFEFIDHFSQSQLSQPQAFKQIGSDPTAALGSHKIQLLPCTQHNLSLFQRNLQQFPFYIEISKHSFSLFISYNGLYWKIPCQRHEPLNLKERSHPVITLETSDKAHEFSYCGDIPWSDIAQQLGTPVEPILNNFPVNPDQFLTYRP